MSRKRFTVDSIVCRLREAEVELSRVIELVRWSGNWASVSRRTTAGVESTGVCAWIRLSVSRS